LDLGVDHLAARLRQRRGQLSEEQRGDRERSDHWLSLGHQCSQFVSHFSATLFGPTRTFGPLLCARRSCQQKSPIGDARSELATVSDRQCSREAMRPALTSAAAPYNQGASYSFAKGVTVAHITVVWFDGKEASERWKGSKSVVPSPSSGRARPTAYL